MFLERAAGVEALFRRLPLQQTLAIISLAAMVLVHDCCQVIMVVLSLHKVHGILSGRLTVGTATLYVSTSGRRPLLPAATTEAQCMSCSEYYELC